MLNHSARIVMALVFLTLAAVGPPAPPGTARTSKRGRTS